MCGGVCVVVSAQYRSGPLDGGSCFTPRTSWTWHSFTWAVDGGCVVGQSCVEALADLGEGEVRGKL